jgi:hypothetical protein
VLNESEMKSDLTTKCELSDAIEIDVLEVFENAKPSIN